MVLLLAGLLLAAPAPAVHCPLGLPVTIGYPIPEGWVASPISSDTTAWFVTLQEGGEVTLVPLALDTLILPDLEIRSDSLVRRVQAPLLVVDRTMPDTTWAMMPFPAPLETGLPPGFPADYLRRHEFWKDWGPPPPPGWILPAALAAAAAAGALLVILWRRRKATGSETVTGSSGGRGPSPEDEALALMETPAFARGDWPEYYRAVEKLLRDTVTSRFGPSNPALTWRQVERLVRDSEGGDDFLRSCSDLTREIALQRYASWGGSRDRARKHTLNLAAVRREWHT